METQFLSFAPSVSLPHLFCPAGRLTANKHSLSPNMHMTNDKLKSKSVVAGEGLYQQKRSKWK